MLLLGIDTSGKVASAALFDADKEIFLGENSLYTQKTHSQVIMPTAKALIEQTGKKNKRYRRNCRRKRSGKLYRSANRRGGGKSHGIRAELQMLRRIDS